MILPWGEPKGHLRRGVLATLAKDLKFDLGAPWGELSEDVQQAILHGMQGKKLKLQYQSEKWAGTYETAWEGVVGNVERRYRETSSDAVRNQLQEYMTQLQCVTCEGHRLKAESLSVLVGGLSLGSVADLSVDAAREFFGTLLAKTGRAGGLSAEIADPVLKGRRQATLSLRCWTWLLDVGTIGFVAGWW
ncbi:hypothetical protein ACFL3B_05185 [Gemmatimonadota bacterium]